MWICEVKILRCVFWTLQFEVKISVVIRGFVKFVDFKACLQVIRLMKDMAVEYEETRPYLYSQERT